MPIKDCPPFSPCFCESHPNVKQCEVVTLKIDSHIYILLLAVVILAFKKLRPNNNSKP